MKQKTLAIALSSALLTGLASLDAVAGKGGGGGGASSGRSGGGGMSGMGGGMQGMGGGMSKGAGSGGSMKGTSGMGGMKGSGGMSGMGDGGSMGKAAGTQSSERHRIGEKDDMGVRTRDAYQAR